MWNFLVKKIKKDGIASKYVIRFRKLKGRKSIIGELGNKLFMFVIEGDFDMIERVVEYFWGEKNFVKFIIIGGRVEFHDVENYQMDSTDWLIDIIYLLTLF